MSTSHALRRRFGLELTLGLALALVAILVVRRERRESPEFERPGGAASTAVDSPALVLRPSSSPAPLPSASVAQRTPVLPETPSATIAPALPSPDALQVEVVDERGNPLAGIDVGIIGSGPGGSRITLRAATSTADGRASLPRRVVDEMRVRAAALATPFTLLVGVVPALDGWPRIELPEPLDWTVVLRLVLPAEIRELFRPLSVRVVDTLGTPLGGVPVALVAWHAHDRGSSIELARADTRSIDGVAELSLGVSRDRFQYAGFLGEMVRRVELALPFREPPGVDLGPLATSREVVTLVLAGTGSLAVRVLDPSGCQVPDGVRVGLSVRVLEDAVDAWSTYWFAPTEGGLASFPWIGTGLELRLRASTEDRSWGELEVRGPAPGAVEEVVLRLNAPEHLVPADPAPAAAPDMATIEVPLPEPCMVRGEIRDETGALLAGARIALALGAEGAGIQALAVSREDGSFEVGLRSEPGPALLRVREEGYLDFAQAVTLGATQVVVRLERAACFEARVLLDPGFPSVQLSFELDGVAFSPLLRPLLRCDIPPGVHDFEVRTSGSDRLLERIEGIRLEPGENTIDPRLDPLDLRGRWVVSSWRLLASDGSPLAGPLRVRIEGLGEAQELAREDGRLILVVPLHAAIELELDGFATRTVYPARDEQELTFARSE